LDCLSDDKVSYGNGLWLERDLFDYSTTILNMISSINNTILEYEDNEDYNDDIHYIVG